MAHYRQILINMSVEDDVPEEKLKELANQVETYIAHNIDTNEVHDVQVTLN